MARTDSPWEIEGNYLQTTGLNGYDILINGLNRYLNFNVLNGILGYGFRDNNGTMEFKNSGGAWEPIISSGGAGIPVDNEVLNGAVNGSNKIFTLAHTPIAGCEHVFNEGGQRLSVSNGDYTIIGDTIILTNAPINYAPTCDYRY